MTTTITQDAFIVRVRYDGGPRLYHWPRNDWPALYVLEEPLFCKLSDCLLVLATNELLDLKRVEMCSVDMGVRLWPKVSLILTTNDFDTGHAYDPNVWTARQRHGFRNFKVTLSEPRLRDEEMLRVGGQPVEWTNLCVLQPCLHFDDSSSPVTMFKASPLDTYTLATDAASIKQLTITVTDTVDDAKSPWFDTGFTHLTVHFHCTRL